jgi:hypothetical protein
MKVVIAIVSLMHGIFAHASDIASCSDPSGKGYFPEIGLVAKKDSGWSDEKITGGVTKVIKIGENEYDVLFVDTRKEIVSARRDGGRVLLLNRGKNAFSLLVVYPGTTAEVYTFLKSTSGQLEYIQTLSRAGDAVLITKSSVMRGKCSYISFEAL